jgi:beta-lactamase superfamily II metal-dependent hydrolase
MVFAGLLSAILAAPGCGGGAEPQPAPDGRFKAAESRPRGPLAPPAEAGPPGRLRLEVLDLAGVGEATLVRCPCPGAGHWLLVDAGGPDEAGGAERFQRALAARLPAGERLEVLVVTHEDPAHLGGAAAVLAAHPVGLYVDNGRAAAGDPTWRAAEEALAARPPEHYLNVRREGQAVLDIDFCPRPDVGAEVLRQAGFGQTRFADEASVVVRVVHGQAVAVLMGDAGRDQEEALLRQPELLPRLRCDLLRVGNGGDRGSSTAAFLEVARPRLAAIACPPPAQGVNKHLGLPKKAVLDRLAPWLEPRPGGPGEVRVCDDEASPPAETDELGDPIEEEALVVEAGWVGSWTTLSVEEAVWITAGTGDLRFESDGVRFARVD